MPDEASMEGRVISTDTTKVKAPLRSSFADDPEMRDLLVFFVDDLGRRVEAIRRALLDQDRAQLHTLAHQLSGSAGGYGYTSIGDVARLLEKQVQYGQTSPASLPRLHPTDQLSDEMELSLLHERAEDLISICRRAISTVQEDA
jgi:HPt (histidine-containing phosphotransfer) domain-containing protein